MGGVKLLFFLAVWKRPEITEICFMGLKRLRESGKFPIDVLAVISEESMIPLCEKYDVKYCMHENQPLGAKKNFGLQCALELDFDYLVEIGSDDLIKTELLDRYAPLFKRGVSVIGICNFAVIDSGTGACKEYREGFSASFGLARTMKRDVIERIGKLWPDEINKGLDGKSHFKITKAGFFGKRVSTDEPLAIDIKSDVNIWSFDQLPGSRISFEKATKGLSEEEIEALKALQYVKA
jgi:glycosyltransferase involved in cell wall biosynthesis